MSSNQGRNDCSVNVSVCRYVSDSTDKDPLGGSTDKDPLGGSTIRTFRCSTVKDL